MIFKNCSVGNKMYVDKPMANTKQRSQNPSNSRANMNDSVGDDSPDSDVHYWEDQ